MKGGGTTSQTNKTRDKISIHPYKHATAIASSCTGREADDTENDAAQQADRRLSPSLFAVAGIIGGAEYDPYHKYRHNLYPFKEQLAHEVNKLVLEKQNLDKLTRAAAAATSSRHQEEAEEDETDSYDDDGSDDDTVLDDDDDECLLSSSSTLVDEDEEITD